MERALESTVSEVLEPLVSAEFPATANQVKYWREVHLPRGGAALNVAIRRLIRGRLSDKAIAAALQALIDRHEILRTRFREKDDGTLVQEVLEGVRFKLDQVDLRHLPANQRDAELARLGAAEARKPFAFTQDASPPTLFRVLHVRTGPESACLHFTFHHLMIDGWSIELVINEFSQLAAAKDAGTAVRLPPVDMHFGDYAMWQADLLAGPALDHEREFWRRKLADLPRFEVAPDRPRPAANNDGEIRSILLPRELTDRFEALAHARRHTMFSFASAAATAALHLITGEPEIVLGTQMAGREDPDAEAIVGPLLNTVVLRLPVDGGSSFTQFADGVREVIQEAIEHQHLPFGEVMKLTGDAGTPTDTPLYSVNMIVQRTNISSATITNTDYGAFRVDSAPAHPAGALWDLSLFMVAREEGWRLSCEGARALYDTATIDWLLAVVRRVIEAVTERPDAPLADLVRLDPAERRPGRTATVAAPATPAVRRNPRIEALRTRILALQAKGRKTPVIAINNASVLYPVARAIGDERPFHDVQFCPSPVPVDLPRRHFTDHARDAVELIRLAQPQGPYVLFGLCICGAIAIEAARILQSEGEEVPLVILNDTYRPGYRERLGLIDRQIRRWQIRWHAFHKLHRLVQAGELTPAQWIDNYRVLRALGVSRWLTRLGLLERAEARDVMHESNRWFTEGVLLASQAQFVPEPYHGRVVLFRSAEAAEGRLFPHDFGWGGYIEGEFEVVRCPGAHDAMFRKEGAAVIAATLERLLDGQGR